MITVAVRVHPGASREAVSLLDDGSLDGRVRPRAIDGKANEGMSDVLASGLGLRKRDVRLSTGTHSRQQLVELQLPRREELRHRPAEAG